MTAFSTPWRVAVLGLVLLAVVWWAPWMRPFTSGFSTGTGRHWLGGGGGGSGVQLYTTAESCHHAHESWFMSGAGALPVAGCRFPDGPRSSWSDSDRDVVRRWATSVCIGLVARAAELRLVWAGVPLERALVDLDAGQWDGDPDRPLLAPNGALIPMERAERALISMFHLFGAGLVDFAGLIAQSAADWCSGGVRDALQSPTVLQRLGRCHCPGGGMARRSAAGQRRDGSGRAAPPLHQLCRSAVCCGRCGSGYGVGGHQCGGACGPVGSAGVQHPAVHQ
jgi:hypothetical protein